MAIEHVYIQQNTSIIQDEVLAHRLGLIPIDADARQFDMIGEDDEATDLNTLVFKLDVSCTNADFADPNAPVATSGPETKHVYSGDMEWQPQGLQQERFPGTWTRYYPFYVGLISPLLLFCFSQRESRPWKVIF